VSAKIASETRDEVLLEGGGVIGVFGLLVALSPQGAVLESVLQLHHVDQLELGEANNPDVLDHYLQRLILAQSPILIQLQTLKDGCVDVVKEAFEHFRLEDLDAFEVEADALCAHGVPLQEHEGAEDPVIESSVNVDPLGHQPHELVSLQTPSDRQSLVDASAERSKVSPVYIQEGFLHVLELLVVGDDEFRPVH
jgi:hypothetical protein